MSRRGPRRLFEAIEQAPAGAWSYGLLVAAWIFARNLLEGVLEASHVMGFDWRIDVSLPMFFLHFPLFYFTLFLLLAVWLHVVTGGDLARIARVLAVGFVVLLVAPLLDAFISSGRGYDLKYLLGFDSIVWRFWNPGRAPAEISPGQRVEIALAVVLLGLYGYHLARASGTRPHGAPRPGRGRGLALPAALACAAGSFFLMAALGAWPALFARIWLPAAQGAQAAYLAAYRGPGLVANESARHALAIALPFLAALLLFAWRLAPERFSALARRVVGLRLAHYTGLVPLGAAMGWLVYREHLPGAFNNPVDGAAVIVLWASVTAAFVAAVCWNDLGDLRADGINLPGRPLPAGRITAREMEHLGAVAALLALWLSLSAGYASFLLVAACLALAWLYSRPPMRLKRWPLAATFTLALLSVTSMAVGFSLFAQEMTPWVFPRRVLYALLAGITLGFAAKDLGDGEGDRASGTVTIATLWGEARAGRIAAVLVAVSFLQAGLFLPLGLAGWLAAGFFAAAGVVTSLRVFRPGAALLVQWLLFAVTLAVLLAHHPELLRERVPPWLGLYHGEIRAIEEQVRLDLLERQAAAESGEAGAARTPAREALAAALARFVAATGAEGPGGDADASRPELWRERARWARARSGDPGIARGDAAALASMRPLYAPYRDAWKSAAYRAGDAGEAEAACSGALETLVRPGDFLRERAALRLAAGRAGLDAEVGGGPPALSAPRGERGVGRSAGGELACARDLAGALLFGAQEARVWILAGDFALGRAIPEQAREAYAEAIRLAPAVAEAWSGLGEALDRLGSLPAALEAMEQAHLRSPADPWILNNWGVVLREAGRLQEALERFAAARRLAPQLFEPPFNLGLCFERLGQLEDARTWYTEAGRLRPHFPPVEEALQRVGSPAATAR